MATPEMSSTSSPSSTGSEPPAAVDAVRRPTGDIPLSWALPAEDVSNEAPSPPTSNAKIVLAVLGVGAVIAVGFALRSQVNTTPTTPPPTPQVQTLTPTQPRRVASAEADLDQAVAASNPTATADGTDTETTAIEDEVDGDASAAATLEAQAPAEAEAKANANAQALIRNARLVARNGDDVRALELGERSVVADPNCGECWKTLGLLRFRNGDRAGAVLAKARAKALAPP